MFSHKISFRIRYAETDKMGYVYYGNYATFLEMGRVECLRSLGISYKELEENGIMMPVLEMYQKFFKPAFYDDELSLITMIHQMPSLRIKFEYAFYKNDLQIGTAHTTLVFVDMNSMKPIAIPQQIKEVLLPYFNK